ncbi:MAG: hypothetical protein NTW19_18215 [Planctomycetota bacterium]|nr:hypothetical protein [Planctomycetota bacterium]
MALQWRAVCPACGHRVPRSGILSETARCAGCSASLRQNPGWNRVFYALFTVVAIAGGLTTLFVVRQADNTALTIGCVIAFLLLLLPASAWAWPYCTKYDPAPVAKSDAPAAAEESRTP